MFLTLLPRSATGQPMPTYASFLTGPRRPGELDGPEALHIVILDNGRSQLLADPVARPALSCIRCGACLNACPVAPDYLEGDVVRHGCTVDPSGR